MSSSANCTFVVTGCKLWRVLPAEGSTAIFAVEPLATRLTQKNGLVICFVEGTALQIGCTALQNDCTALQNRCAALNPHCTLPEGV